MKSDAEKFWANVEVAGVDECWPWVAAVSPNGYGDFRRGRAKNHMSAHRFAYEDKVGPIPEGLQIDHLCRNRTCVNPAHLEAVTQAENMRRGEGPQAVNARKTHCPQGHPYSGDNLAFNESRGRYCRECDRTRARERMRRQRATETESRGPVSGAGGNT